MISLEAYRFQLPDSLIAHTPHQPPDQSKLLYVPRKKSFQHYVTKDLPSLLPRQSLIIANDTKVVPARIKTHRMTGGSVEILPVRETSQGKWLSLVKGKVKQGEEINLGEVTVKCLEKNQDGLIVIDFADNNVPELLKKIGEVPLPPYIQRKSDEKDIHWYQTQFAKCEGAVAAPTAGLHFTSHLIKSIKHAGHEIEMLTLHVGPGTFMPVRCDDPLHHRVLDEAAFISKEVVEKIWHHKRRGYPIIALGTTVARTLETLALRGEQGEFNDFIDLTITPPYRFRLVDHLLTNFHLPSSSLLLLVSAFATRKRVLKAYDEAIKNNYRFYSYGDLTFFQ